MTRLLLPQDELDQFFATSTADFAATIKRIARAMLDGRMNEEKALDALSKRVTETMTLAHLYGRRRILLETDAAYGGKGWSDPEPAQFADLIPKVPFSEAILDLLNREPRLGQNWRQIADLYQNSHVFAAVRSANREVTQRVQKAISGILKGGEKLSTATRVLREIDGWSEAYAETVFRTNAATAYSQGRQEEAARPLVRQRMPAWELFTAEDRDVRFNHAAAHGLLALTTDPVWEVAMPPNGFQCRCAVRLVSVEELNRGGWLEYLQTRGPKYPESWSAFHPDPGFERRTMGLVG